PGRLHRRGGGTGRALRAHRRRRGRRPRPASGAGPPSLTREKGERGSMLDPDVDTLLAVVPQGSEAAFPREELDRRVAALQARLAERNVDLYLTSGPENVFYLSGQQTPGYYTFQCLAVPAAGRPFHVLRALESMNARANTYLEDIAGYADDANPAQAVAEAVRRHGFAGKRIAIDQNAWYLTVNLYSRLVAELGPLLDGSGLVESLRRVKSPRELAE